jgi:hypothetical protein
MERHEEIKRQCMQLLNYYNIIADSEFVLPTNERIDVVGYYKSKNTPDIGIEVELSSSFQHDAQKLAGTKSIEWCFIVTEINDTLSLGETVIANGKTIFVFQPHDLSINFETKLREITGQWKKPWFNEFTKIIMVKYKKSSNILQSFVEEVNEQGLNVYTAKDIIFRSGMGGIHYGNYRQNHGETEFNRINDVPIKELMYLSARNFVFENRVGRNYEAGKQSIYVLSENGKDLAKNVIDERIEDKKEGIKSISKEYGNNALVISLLGNLGKFVKRVDPSIFKYHTPLLLFDTEPYGLPRDLIEGFNLTPDLFYMVEIVASLPQLEGLEKEIYESLLEKGLGNKVKAYSSKGDYYGDAYVVPFITILGKIEMDEWLESINKIKVNEFCKWVILASHNPHVPETLYRSMKFLKVEVNEISSMVDETFKLGLTSKLLKDNQNTLAIYDESAFMKFCEDKMNKLLSEILEKDD